MINSRQQAMFYLAFNCGAPLPSSPAAHLVTCGQEEWRARDGFLSPPPYSTASLFFHCAAPSGAEQVQVTHSRSEILPFRPRGQSERWRRFEMR